MITASRRIVRFFVLVLVLAWAPQALANELGMVCEKEDGIFYGHPFALERVFEIDDEVGPLLPAGALFPDSTDSSTDVEESTCLGGGMAGKVGCVAEEIEGAGAAGAGSDGTPPPESEIETAARRAVEGLAGDPSADAVTAGSESPRVLRQVLMLRPVLTPGSPGTLRYEPAGAGMLFPPEGGLSETEIARLAPRMSAANAALLDFSTSLDAGAQEALIDGIPRPVPLPEAVPGSSLAGDPPTLAMGAECGSLFRALAERARLRGLRAEKLARVERFKTMLADERAKAGLLGLVWDSEQADRIERAIAEEERQLGLIDGRLAEEQAIIDRRNRVLAEDERRREIEAIKADPERLAAETEQRRDALIAAAQEKASAKWRLIEGEAAYAREIASYKAMIASARERGEDALADALEADMSRLESARDSWRVHANAMLDNRIEEERQLTGQNRADGIGPEVDASELLLAEGRNPTEVIEASARERARAAAQRRASADAQSLGGAATETYGAMDFGQDVFETNLEMARDPLLFYERYGSYMKGVGKAAYDGVVDIAKLGWEAADTAGEAFESGLTDVTGYEFNSFGRENLDTLVAAGTHLSKADAEQIVDLASEAGRAADRRLSQMAAGGERGLQEALETTGYVAGSALGAEEIALAGALRTASTVSDLVRVGDNVAGIAKKVDNLADAGLAAKTDNLGDAAQIGKTSGGASSAADAPLAEGQAGQHALTPSPTATSAAPNSPPPSTKSDALPATDKAGTDAGSGGSAATAKKTSAEESGVGSDADTPAVREDAGTVDPDATVIREDAAQADPDAPAIRDDVAPVDPDATTIREGVAQADPDAPTVRDDVASVDPDAPTIREDVAQVDPDAPTIRDDVAPVDRDATTIRDDTGTGVDRDAPTVREGVDAGVDRDAPTVREDVGEGVDRDAPTLRDEQDAADPDALAARTPDPPAPDTPDLPPNPPEPLHGPDPGTPGVQPDAGAGPQPAGVADANQARAPPVLERKVKRIDESVLDTKLDTSPDYEFSRSIFDPASVPEGGEIAGSPTRFKHKKSERAFPGSEIIAPDGSKIELGEVKGIGGFSAVVAQGNDPTKVVKLSALPDVGKNWADDGALVDLVGRRVGEAIQNPSGNGNFRLTKVDQQFIVTDQASGKRWLVTVEDNIEVVLDDGTKVTNAAQRFATRAPDQKEALTMALAIREMNNRGVIWTDHKPANFDIVPNPEAPTGYQMLIFDAGGIRPMKGATAESRARAAREMQRTFDQLPNGNQLTRNFGGSGDSVMASFDYLDNRVFGSEIGPAFTPGTLYRSDNYFDHAMMPDDEFRAYVRSTLGRDVNLPIAPP